MTNVDSMDNITYAIPTTCIHCGKPIAQSPSGQWNHTRGPGSVIHRCQSDAAPYGHNAHPEMAWPVNDINDCLCVREDPCDHLYHPWLAA